MLLGAGDELPSLLTNWESSSERERLIPEAKRAGYSDRSIAKTETAFLQETATSLHPADIPNRTTLI
jgi:hypothetical protein